MPNLNHSLKGFLALVALLPGKPLVGVICPFPGGSRRTPTPAFIIRPQNKASNFSILCECLIGKSVIAASHASEFRLASKQDIETEQRPPGRLGVFLRHLILPRWLSHQRVTDSLVAYTNLHTSPR